LAWKVSRDYGGIKANFSKQDHRAFLTQNTWVAKRFRIGYSDSMKTFILLAIIWSGNCFAAVAYIGEIKDPEGYSNIRQLPNKDSKIIGKITKGESFHVGKLVSEIYVDSLGWWPVAYGDVIGFIHRSRVKLGKKSQAFHFAMRQTKKKVFVIYLAQNKFEPSKHKIVIDEKNSNKYFKYVKSIGGRPPIGTDNGMPTREIAKFKVLVDGRDILFPRDQFADCFHPNFGEDYIKVIVDNPGKKILVNMLGSDGAGGFRAYWIIDTDGNHQRFVSEHQ
jgi:hypothetical protein